MRKDENLMTAIKTFDADVRFSENGDDVVSEFNDRLQSVSFIMSSFENETFEQIQKKTSKIFGPTAVHYYAQLKRQLPVISRPLFCTSMNKVVACFTRLRDKALFVSILLHTF